MIEIIIITQLVLILFIFIILCYISFDIIDYDYDYDYDNTLTYSRNKCKYIFDGTMKKSITDNNLKNINNHNKSNLIIPCTYDNIDREINEIPEGENRNILIINGADEITAKNYLWRNIVQYHGLENAKKLTPNTFLLTGIQREIDIKRMKEECKDKYFILKKNIQRQLGLKITNNISDIEKEDDYVLAQELIMDNYLLNKRKINLRVYIVVICHQNKTNVYMFDDGFIYYTKNEFNINDYSNDNNITTGYVDREVYEINPLTHTDFKKYLDLNNYDYYHEKNQRILTSYENSIQGTGSNLSTIVFNRIENLFKNVFSSFKGRICKKYNDDNKKVKIYDDYSIQIFGADVGINTKLEPILIEVNKGPDLSPKDSRDGNIKTKLINNVYELIGLRKYSGNDNGLKLILSM
jgi:hypothetical protein